MKARVIATGKIVEVKEEYDLRNAMPEVFYSNEEDPYEVYEKEELDFDVKEKSFPKDFPDYWTRLEHQYVGMAMQGILSNPHIAFKDIKVDTVTDVYVDNIIKIAHALVEKYKKEERK